MYAVGAVAVRREDALCAVACDQTNNCSVTLYFVALYGYTNLVRDIPDSAPKRPTLPVSSLSAQ